MSANPVQEPVAPIRQLPRFVGPVEVATALGISRSGVYALVDKGQLPQPIRVGNSLRWSEAAIFDFIENGGTVQRRSL
jgi:excisionase family DNA binding protein